MANYSNLKAAIAAAIKTNGNQEITGQVLQDVLTSIVSVIGANYTFAGVATPSTNPGTPDQNVVYMASQAGTYTNFGGIELPAGISLLMWNGAWAAQTFFGLDDEPTAKSNNLVNSGGVYSYINSKVLNPDITTLYGVVGNFPNGRYNPQTIRYSFLLDVSEGDVINVKLDFGYKCFLGTWLGTQPTPSSVGRDLGDARSATIENGEKLLTLSIGKKDNTSISEDEARSVISILINSSFEQKISEVIQTKSLIFTGKDNTLQSNDIRGLVAGTILHINIPVTNWNISNISNTYPVFIIDYVNTNGTITELEYLIKNNYTHIAHNYYIEVPSDIGKQGIFSIRVRANSGVQVNVNIEDYTSTYKVLTPLYSEGQQGGLADGRLTTNTQRYRVAILKPVPNKVIECIAKSDFVAQIHCFNSLLQSASTYISGNSDFVQRPSFTIPSNCKSIVIIFKEIHNYDITDEMMKDAYTINYSDEDFNVSDCYNNRFSIIGSGNTISRKTIKGLVKNKRYRFSTNNGWNTSTVSAGYLIFGLSYYDTTNTSHDIVVVTKTNPQTLSKFYEFDVPSDINIDGELIVSVRADIGENVLLNIEPIELPDHVINSKIFHSCKQAWTDKINKYESWPNGGVIADGDQIIMFYNSSSAHVARDLVSDVVMRKKTTLGDWGEKTIILQHTSSVGYCNPSCCILPNGDYLVICSILTSDNVSAQQMPIKMIKSSDKGATWTDMGNVQVEGTDVLDECMMDLFCTSTGKLISFVGGTVNSKFIVSDDNGQTWRFVGNTLSNCLEACFYERSNGEIISILRKNSSDPALIKLNAELTSYEILYTFGTFKFPAYYNPTSIIKLQDNKLYLLGGSRRTDTDGHFMLFEAIVTEEELLSNNFKSRVILKANANILQDWGYAQAVIANDGNIYGYFYDGSINGITQIYEMLGC